MNGYEKFKQIMADLEYKKRLAESKDYKDSLPPGFDELFKGFKK